MRWRQGRRSSNVDDRRGQPRGGRRAKLGGGAVLIALVAALLFGQDPLQLLQQLGGVQGTSVSAPAGPRPAAENEAADFSSVVLADTEDVWNGLFRRSGSAYRPPVLVLYSGVTDTGCGLGQSASGPFYCPADNRLYIDLEFLA
ncbi:MAG: neutral zinc metallopeptidase, partial [Pseudomonadota bacterium]